MAQNKKDALDVLFPGKAIPITDKLSVEVRPLTLADLPKVTSAFAQIIKMAGQGVPPSELGAEALTQFLLLLPMCINLPAEQVPTTVIPEIIEAMIEQNITDEVIKKWKGLVEKTDLLKNLSFVQAAQKKTSQK